MSNSISTVLRDMSSGITVEKLIDLRPGGFSDTLATMAIASPILTASPALPPAVLAASSFAALAGSLWWTKRYIDVSGSRVMDSEITVESNVPPELEDGEDGMTLGYCVDTGLPLTIPFENWTRHGFIAGQSGVGKTVQLFDNVLFQQIIRGGGALAIDGKIDNDNLNLIRKIMAYAGRSDDLIVIDTGSPEMTNTYNPVLFGDPDEVASRLVSVIQESSNAGQDFYRQEVTQALTILITAIQATGKAYNLMDLAICLMSTDALEAILEMIPEGSGAKALFMTFLKKYRRNNGELNLDSIQKAFGGMVGRLLLLGSGNFGGITSSYNPDLQMYDAIMEGKVIYVALETMGKQEVSMQFGKILIGDLRSALAKIQRLPKNKRPKIPFLSLMDEAGSYMTEALGRIFEQARSAKMTMLPAVQTLQNLTAVSEQLLEFVLGNTEVNIFFRLGSDETAGMVADMIGEEMQKAVSLSNTSNQSSDKTPVASDVSQQQKSTDGFSFSEQTVKEHRVTKEMLKGLGIGEAIVLYQKSKVYHVRMPTVDLFDVKLPKFVPNKYPAQRARKGLNYYLPEVQEMLAGNEMEWA